jgi:hypothetical protein
MMGRPRRLGRTTGTRRRSPTGRRSARTGGDGAQSFVDRRQVAEEVDDLGRRFAIFAIAAEREVRRLLHRDVCVGVQDLQLRADLLRGRVRRQHRDPIACGQECRLDPAQYERRL